MDNLWNRMLPWWTIDLTQVSLSLSVEFEEYFSPLWCLFLSFFLFFSSFILYIGKTVWRMVGQLCPQYLHLLNQTFNDVAWRTMFLWSITEGFWNIDIVHTIKDRESTSRSTTVFLYRTFFSHLFLIFQIVVSFLHSVSPLSIIYPLFSSTFALLCLQVF